ncbi:hypothetical protein E8E13_007575 [Curvularia kusanoi]|uniref:DUF6594 domain-containing protein n=1 Tax=Curvularia kusanoi TaxID=90978 RepID=A0A9P4T9X1_CURKU|nr:hypothetical protein E8E13_007575 [Curvularia kusanoi]
MGPLVATTASTTITTKLITESSPDDQGKTLRDLNTRNLLYFKAQIDALQIRILEQEEEQGLQMERYDTIAKHHNPDKKKQNHVYHSLLMDMRELLADYNEALLRYSKVSALSDPEAHNMRSLTNVLSAVGRPVNARGPEGRDTTWGDFPESTNSNWAGARAVVKALLTAKQPPKSNRDLVVTHQAAKIDGLTKWIVYWLMPFYWCMRDSYNSAKASSTEIFAATAAFSAVMVVFISQPIIQISPESNVSM